MSRIYLRVWRWHFYAGLVCAPFLALMALTGSLYLFKEPIESLLYAPLRVVEASSAPIMDAESLVARARAAAPGEPTRYVAPARADRSAEVGLRTADGAVSVYLDPASGQVLGSLPDDTRLLEIVKRIHSLVIVGAVANLWVEVVAGWAIVLVVSGIFLWWPRSPEKALYSVRGRPAQRTWWRDLHAVVGVTAAVAILFLAVTGMPWSAFWGQQFGRLTNELGIGLPRYLFGPSPEATVPLASLGDVPWVLSQTPLPQSGAQPTPQAAPQAAPRDDHAEHTGSASPASADQAASVAGSLGLNDALRLFAGLGLPAGTPVTLPSGPRGVYTATLFPDDVRGQRVVHLDRYSGAVLADVGCRDYGIAGRLTEWGVNLHTGVQFGWINKLVMLAGCVAILTLAATGTVMWWKRRPPGRLAAPPRRVGDRAALGAITVAVMLGLLYPLLGASMIAALLIDAAVPERWHERFGL